MDILCDLPSYYTLYTMSDNRKPVWRRIIKYVVFILIIVAALIGLNMFFSSRTVETYTPPLKNVVTAEAEMRDIKESVTVSSYVESQSMVPVVPFVSGTIEEYNIEAGDKVEEGDVIAVIDKEPYELQVAQAEAAYKALTDGFDALEASIDAKEEEKELALEKLQADLEETYAPVEAKRLELVPLDGLLMAIAHAIADYAGTGEAVWDQESIDNYIANIEAEIQNLELDKFDAETLLLRAQDNLNKWNNDAIKALEIYANNVADAETIVERRKAEVDKIQAALDAVIASLTNDPTASTEETPSTQE